MSFAKRAKGYALKLLNLIMVRLRIFLASMRTRSSVRLDTQEIGAVMSIKFSQVVDLVLNSPDCKPIKDPKWVGVIIHHTGISKEIPKDETEWRSLNKNIANWLAKKDDVYVSAHFQIGRYGEVIQIVDPRTHIAFHAGVSEMFHPTERKVKKGCNDFTVGIELLGDGNRLTYSESQYEALALLMRDILKEYPSIDPRCITGHENVSPGRKDDPGKYFDWPKLFKSLYI